MADCDALSLPEKLDDSEAEVVPVGDVEPVAVAVTLVEPESEAEDDADAEPDLGAVRLADEDGLKELLDDGVASGEPDDEPLGVIVEEADEDADAGAVLVMEPDAGGEPELVAEPLSLRDADADRLVLPERLDDADGEPVAE